MTRSLHQRFHARGLSSVAFHPGMVRSNFALGSSSLMRMLYASPLAPLVTITSERSEEHTSELQSRGHLVCRLLLEKKKKQYITTIVHVYNLSDVRFILCTPCLI